MSLCPFLLFLFLIVVCLCSAHRTCRLSLSPSPSPSLSLSLYIYIYIFSKQKIKKKITPSLATKKFVDGVFNLIVFLFVFEDLYQLLEHFIRLDLKDIKF